MCIFFFFKKFPMNEYEEVKHLDSEDLCKSNVVGGEGCEVVKVI